MINLVCRGNILSLEQFFILVDYIKSLKSEYICITYNTIIGSNEEISQVSIIDNIYTGIPYGEILYLSYDHIIDLSKNIEGNLDIYKELYDRSNHQNKYILIEVLNKFRYNINLKNNISDIYIENLKDDNIFNSIMNMKAEDGAFFYKIADDIGIYIYKSLIPSLKSEPVSLKFYLINNSSIGEFIIKKKKYWIRKYIYFLNL